MRVVYWQMAWMIGTVLTLVAFGRHSYELFFLLTVLGLLVIADLTAPSVVQPQWRSRLRTLIVLGLIGFTIVVLHRLLEIQGIAILS